MDASIGAFPPLSFTRTLAVQKVSRSGIEAKAGGRRVNEWEGEVTLANWAVSPCCSARRSHSRDWPGVFGRANLQDMIRIAIVFLAFAMVGLTPRDGAPAEATAAPTVVELFTSQSCYSCPPAETFLGELAGRPDVLALEFHVDYWDDLVYGSAGRWKDVFSKPAYTRRQRGYNVSLRGKNSVYTPQMVIDGAAEAVGFRRGAVFSAIEAAASHSRPRVRVALSAGAASGLTIRLAGDAAGPATVWLLRFLRAQTTRVAAGENKDNRVCCIDRLRRQGKSGSQ